MNDLPPMTSRFDEEKATTAAALFIGAAGKAGKNINYMKLLKLMYILERNAIIRWGHPVIGGDYFSLDHGPIANEVCDLILGRPKTSRGIWAKFISTPTDYTVELQSCPPVEALNRAEVKLIDEVIAQYGHYTEWELSRLCHDEFPEWRDPNGSRLPIRWEDILKAAEKTPQEIYEIRKSAQEANTLDSIFEGR